MPSGQNWISFLFVNIAFAVSMVCILCIYQLRPDVFLGNKYTRNEVLSIISFICMLIAYAIGWIRIVVGSFIFMLIAYAMSWIRIMVGGNIWDMLTSIQTTIFQTLRELRNGTMSVKSLGQHIASVMLDILYAIKKGFRSLQSSTTK